MNIEEKIIGSLYLIRLNGLFHSDEVETLHSVFEKALKEGKRIVLEMGFSKPPSYTILEPLLTLAGTTYASGGKLDIARATGNLRFLLTMLNKHDWFEFHEAINQLVIDETNKPSQKSIEGHNNKVEDNIELKPVIYQIPDVTDFSLD